MKLGLDSFSYHIAFKARKLGIPEFIERCAAMGMDGLQFNIGHLGPWLDENPGQTARIRDMVSSLGLFAEVGTRGTDPEHLTTMLRLCDEIGADLLRTYISCGGDLAQELDAAPGHLIEVLPVCSELGIRIGIENHEYETSDQINAVLDAVDSEWVGSHVDTGNSMPVWEEPVEAVRNLAPRAVSTHFKDHIITLDDNTPTTVGVAVGAGNIDVRECFRIFAEESPLDRVVIQVCYGYSAPMRRSQDNGAGGRLGEGAFAVVEGPLDPSFAILRTGPAHPVDDTIAWQSDSVRRSIDHVKALSREIG